MTQYYVCDSGHELRIYPENQLECIVCGNTAMRLVADAKQLENQKKKSATNNRDGNRRKGNNMKKSVKKTTTVKKGSKTKGTRNK